MIAHQLIILILISILILIIGLLIGYRLGEIGLWKELQKTKDSHSKLNLKYDPEKREISLNGTHRISAVVFTKKEIFKMFPNKYAKKIFKESKFNQSEHFN